MELISLIQLFPVLDTSFLSCFLELFGQEIWAGRGLLQSLAHGYQVQQGSLIPSAPSVSPYSTEGFIFFAQWMWFLSTLPLCN